MKKIFSFVIVLMILMTPIFASSAIPEERQLPLLVDDAKLLSDSEYDTLLSKLTEISERNKCEVAVVTVTSTNGNDIGQYAADIYDYYGYGYGENDDGILLLLDMESRKWFIVTYGYGITVMTDSRIDSVGEEIVPYLSDGEYSDAFTTYAEYCDLYIEMTRESSSDGSDGYTVNPLYLRPPVYVAVVPGIIIALIATGIMRGKLKSVASKSSAADYTVKNSLKLTNQVDMFLYTSMSKSARPKDTDRSSGGGGGGSSTFTSSSGRSHGGGGGSF